MTLPMILQMAATPSVRKTAGEKAHWLHSYALCCLDSGMKGREIRWKMRGRDTVPGKRASTAENCNLKVKESNILSAEPSEVKAQKMKSGRRVVPDRRRIL